MDLQIIAKRLSLAIEKADGPWERRYRSESFFGPIIRVKKTTYYHYFGWGVYHLHDRDIARFAESFAAQGVWDKLRSCQERNKKRCPKLRSCGDDTSGSWMWCDARTTEELVDILEAYYLHVFPR